MLFYRRWKNISAKRSKTPGCMGVYWRVYWRGLLESVVASVYGSVYESVYGSVYNSIRESVYESAYASVFDNFVILSHKSVFLQQGYTKL